jgi:hypothetical protein
MITMHPLSHHEIFGLVGPFARRGRHVDLDSSDRVNRCLVFKPVEYPGGAHGLGGLSEVLRLESPGAGLYCLTRELTMQGGLQATLRSEGGDPSELLQHVEAIAPQTQFKFVSGISIALSYRLELGVTVARDSVRRTALVFTRGQAFVEGLVLTLEAAAVNGYPANIVLEPRDGAPLDLPADILAVLGWEWGLLCRRAAGWRAHLRLRRADRGRIGQIENRLEKLVAHLALVLTRPPAEFHDTRLRARWGVTFRRAIPLLVFTGVGAGAIASRHVPFVPDGFRQLLCMSLPPVLLVLGFGIQHRPPLELPLPPRRPGAASWRAVAPAAAPTHLEPATLQPGNG